MPPVVGAAAVTGGFGLLGSLVGAHGASSAASAQERSAAAALQFAREQEAERKREWELMVAGQKAQYEARQAQLAPYVALRASIAAKYGIKIPTSATTYTPPPMPADWKPGDPIPGSTPKPASVAPVGPGDVISQSQSLAPPVSRVPSNRLTLGDITDWSGSIWGRV